MKAPRIPRNLDGWLNTHVAEPSGLRLVSSNELPEEAPRRPQKTWRVLALEWPGARSGQAIARSSSGIVRFEPTHYRASGRNQFDMSLSERSWEFAYRLTPHPGGLLLWLTAPDFEQLIPVQIIHQARKGSKGRRATFRRFFCRTCGDYEKTLVLAPGPYPERTDWFRCEWCNVRPNSWWNHGEYEREHKEGIAADIVYGFRFLPEGEDEDW